MKPRRPLHSLVVLSVSLLIAMSARIGQAATDLGIFESEADIGVVTPPGSAEFDKSTGEYRVKSSGQNIWKNHDDFHFVYRKITGDVVLTAEVNWVGIGKNAHRKAGWMIRQGLEPDAVYADAMVHGDGHVALQYRTKQGDITADTKSDVKAPAILRLERHGDTVSLYVAPKTAKGEKPAEFQLAGSIKIELKDPVYVGLAVSSHDPMVTETAILSGVTLKTESDQPAKQSEK
jgi:TolB protein